MKSAFARASALVLLPLLGTASALAEGPILYWGTDGLGTSGAWTENGVNWWDGAQTVAWVDDADAVFQGAGGEVSTYVFGPTASSLTFATPGYSVTTGWLKGGATGLVVNTVADATLSATLSDDVPFDTNGFIKRGAGTLTVAGTNFFDDVRVEEGEYVATGTSAAFFSDFRVENGAKFTLAPKDFNAISVGSIAGGGIVQPDAQARTVTATIFKVNDFFGQLQDNGPGVLAVNFLSPSGRGSLLLSAATYTGATQINGGALELFGSTGGILNSSSITVNPGATLRLIQFNYESNYQRLGDAIPLQLRNGTLEISNLGTGTENAGALSVIGGSRITLTGENENFTPAIRFASFQRLESGTLTISSKRAGATVTLTGVANGSSGIVTPAITMNNDWVTADATGKLSQFSDYKTTFTGGASSDHVKISAPSLSVAGSTRASLNLLSNNAGVEQTLTLQGMLMLTTGGLLSSGSQPGRIAGGALAALSELIVTNANDLTISSPIVNSGSALALTKSGAGTLFLNASNSYQGVTTINGGALAIASPAALGGGSSIVFGGGTLQARGNFVLSKNLTGLGGNVQIDTNGHVVILTETLSGGLSKTGNGTLELRQTQLGSVSIGRGIVSAPNATSGNVMMADGTRLDASHALDSLSLLGKATLGIGRTNEASDLTLDRISFSGGLDSTALTIVFDLGSAAQDMLVLEEPFGLGPLGTGAFQFAFTDLGGLSTGVNYKVISFGGFGGPLDATNFALTPDLVDAGWQAEFEVNSTGVTVNFAAVPEPASMALLGLGFCGAGLALFRRKRNGFRG